MTTSVIKRKFSSLILKLGGYLASTDWDLSDIYLVSYPKSGTTWLCLILANVLAKTRGDKRRIDFYNVHDYVPDLHANSSHIGRVNVPQRFVKTHEAFPEWHRRISVKGSGKLYPRVIYLVRDGREAVFSYYLYAKAMGQFDGDLREFLLDKYNSRGGWHAHVRDWVVQNDWIVPRSLLLIRYEDLRINPMTELRRILEFSGLKVDEEICKAALQESDVNVMRAIEEKYGDGVRYADPAYRFAGIGERDAERQQFEKQLSSYYQEYDSVFQSLGYQP